MTRTLLITGLWKNLERGHADQGAVLLRKGRCMRQEDRSDGMIYSYLIRRRK